MALVNNLVLALKDLPAVAEALAQRQPGDKVTLNNVEVTIVENLPDRASFDVVSVGSVDGGGGSSEADAPDSTDDTFAASILGVMAKKKK